MDPRIEILLKEYENLRKEELLHKESLRKIHVLIVTAISSFVGTVKLGETPLAIASVLFPPLLLIILSYGIHDLFSIFVIARHISSLEKRVNTLAGLDLLSWESKTCQMIFGRAVARLRENGARRFYHPSTLADILVAIFGVPAFGFSIYSAYLTIGPGTLGIVYVGAIAAGSCALIVITMRTLSVIRTGGELERAINSQFEELHRKNH